MIDVQRQGVTYMHLTTMLGSQTPRRQASSASTLINPRHQWHISSRLPSQSRASSEPSNAGPSTSGRDASAAQPPMKLPPQHAPLTAQPMLHSPRAEASAAGEANPGRAPAPESMLGFDPNLGKGFAPPPGGAPLWWAEKYEQKRKEEWLWKQADPSFITTEERMRATGPSVLSRILTIIAQALQLVVVLALLVLWPASLVEGGLGLVRVWQLYAAYFVFFFLGSVLRVVRFGKFAPRKQDKQVATWRSRLSFIAFLILIPLLHASAVYKYSTIYTIMQPPHTSLYDAIGGSALAAGIFLNAWASHALGRAYDRVVAPEQLVTHGPYQVMQHPIYTSYMLAFFGFAMLLHAAPTGLAMLAVCSAYYSARTTLEARVLSAAFGNTYDLYASRTKRFIPGLL